MTISQRIGQASYREREFELRRQCMEFGQIAHMLMSAGGDTLNLNNWPEKIAAALVKLSKPPLMQEVCPPAVSGEVNLLITN